MSTRTDVFLVQLPSPPAKTVFREWAGGMGTSQPSERTYAGHDPDYYEIPYSQLLWIARGLETRGLSLSYFDLQAEERFDEEAFLAALRAERPRVLITVVNLPSLSSDIALVQRFRAELSELEVLVVGPTGKLVATRLLEEGVADWVMDANEELAVPEIVARRLQVPGSNAAEAAESCWHIVEGEVRKAPAVHVMKDLDFVDFPAYDLIDVERYESDFFFGRRYRYTTVYTSKGCSYDCVYCPYPFGFGAKFLFRSPEKVVDDIERLVRDFGVEQVCFRDQVFTVNKKHTTRICELLIEREVPVVWVCETRYDVVSPELLALMRRAGCLEVHYGLETADEEIFKEVGKPGGPVSLARFEEAIEWTKQADIRVHVHLILGLPGESWTTVRNTMDFLKRTKPHSVQTAILSPYPGTPLYDRLEEEGALSDADWEDYGGFQAVQPTEYLTVAELERAKSWVAWNWDKTAWDKIVLRARRLFARLTG